MRKVYASVGSVGLVYLSAEFSSPGGIMQSASASCKGHPVIHPVVPGGACKISACHMAEYCIYSCGGAPSLADIARDAITFPHRIAVENIDYMLTGEIYINVGGQWRSRLFVSGVLIFAAQDIIKDVLGGLMISIFKPFEIGNRVELEDGTAGIVRDINMRHVVLQLLDTQVVVIPNSKLNTMSVRNYSYLETYRSALFRFYIGYDSDVEKAIQVIRDAIIASAYSMPAKETDHGNDYAPIYFMAYESSSLRLDTTVYYSPSSPTEVVISDINLRVKHALKENGIEIPYTYLNVVQKQVHE